jgi:hypothetical protein
VSGSDLVGDTLNRPDTEAETLFHSKPPENHSGRVARLVACYGLKLTLLYTA